METSCWQTFSEMHGINYSDDDDGESVVRLDVMFICLCTLTMCIRAYMN